MSGRKKALGRVFTFSILLGLIIWHVIRWQTTGLYVEMFELLGEGEGYLTVIFNIGLMVISGLLLGILPGEISDLCNQKRQPLKEDNKGD